MRTEETKRIVKVFIDDKHVKSFPLSVKDHVLKIPQQAMLCLSKSKVLNDSDLDFVSPFIFIPLANDFLLELKKTEKYAYELTLNNPITGTRTVTDVYGKKRFELIFADGLKIKAPELLHKFSSNKLPHGKVNY